MVGFLATLTVPSFSFRRVAPQWVRVQKEIKKVRSDRELENSEFFNI